MDVEYQPIEETTMSTTETTVIETTIAEESTTSIETTTEEDITESTSVLETPTQKKPNVSITQKQETTTKQKETTTSSTTQEQKEMITVWVTPNGKKYHIDKDCPGENAYSVSKPIDSIASKDWCGNCSKEMK